MASIFGLLFFLSIIQVTLSSTANLYKARLFRPDLTQDPPPDSPTTYFEVTKPIKLPKTKPCSSLILQHDFGYTYGQPPVSAPYNPPSNCPSQNFSKIVMEWKATCTGRQFDRIFGVWLSGVEILRSCTAEPRATGIVWTVEKDITRYSSLLKHPQTLAVYMGNLVDKTYTGIYHVNISFHFYPAEETHYKSNGVDLGSVFDSPADLILPISRSLPLNGGLWFLIENSTDVQLKDFTLPRNVYRAVLEVFVSFHENDEFWYSNPPNEFIAANNLTDTPGNGAFREVVVSIDGKVVGAVWPFTVIYTGGVNPLLWRPITGIGSFDLPSYDIEITPFLGKILDRKQHRFAFSVTNALNVWYVDANLHLWLDGQRKETNGQLTKYEVIPFKPSLVSKFKGLNGSFLTTANRHISSTGWVNSSHGKITTRAFQEFDYTNYMVYGENGDLQIVNQTIEANYAIYAKFASLGMYSAQVVQRFPLYLYTETMPHDNHSFFLAAKVSLGFNEKKFSGLPFGFAISSLRNLQHGQGSMIVKGNLVTSGLGSTQQAYKYDGHDDCYFRNVSSRNYTILYDKSRDVCSKGSNVGSGFRFRNLPLAARRVSLSSALLNENEGD